MGYPNFTYLWKKIFRLANSWVSSCLCPLLFRHSVTSSFCFRQLYVDNRCVPAYFTFRDSYQVFYCGWYIYNIVVDANDIGGYLISIKLDLMASLPCCPT